MIHVARQPAATDGVVVLPVVGDADRSSVGVDPLAVIVG